MRNLTMAPLGLIALCSALVLSSCGGDGWKKMSIDGATVSFEMPGEIKQVEDKGMVLYVAQNLEKKRSYRVGILKRNYEEDQKQNANDEKVLTNFAQQVLRANTQQFNQMNMQCKFEFNGNFPVENGLGLQYQAKVKNAFVLDRFYINKMGIYYVECTTQDTNDPDVARFLASFKP